MSTLGLILIIILIVALVGGIPLGIGRNGIGLVGVLLIIVIVLLLTGRL